MRSFINFSRTQTEQPKKTNWILFENCKIWKNPIFSGTQKQHPAGAIENCVHQRQLHKTKGYSQQN